MSPQPEPDRLQTQLEELETLRLRATDLVARLRTELQQKADAYRVLEQRYDTLRHHSALALDQIDTLVQERILIERQVHRLEIAAAEARRRSVESDRVMHEQLLPLADEQASIARSDAWRLIAISRASAGVMIDQLSAATTELAMVTARLALLEAAPARRAMRFTARALHRLKRLAGRGARFRQRLRD